MTVASLGVGDLIMSGLSDVRLIASECNASPDALSRVLRQLAQKGIFEEPETGRFVANDAARGLAGLFGVMTGAWAGLPESVRTGHAALDFWGTLNRRPEVDAEFDALMGPAGHGTPDADLLFTDDEWREVRTFVDVGGGTGAMLAEVLKDRPWMSGILVDRHATIGRARECAYSDRVEYVAQNFFDPLPRGGDVYLIKNTLADWGDAQALALLKRLAEAARPNGRVVIFGGVTDADRPSPELLMLVLVGGKSWTLPQFEELARTAGLRVVRSGKQQSGKFVVILNCVGD